MKALQGQFSLFPDDLFNQVEQYEITIPRLVDENGEFLSHDVTHTSAHMRRRRSVEYSKDGDDVSHPSDEPVFYELKAFGFDFHFNLSLNRDLISPFYSVEGLPGSDLEGLKDCHYVGHLGRGAQVQSRVAVSNCFGLVRNIYHFIMITNVL